MSDDVSEAAKALARYRKEEAWRRSEQTLRNRRDILHDSIGQPLPTFDAFKQQREQEQRPAHHRRIGWALLAGSALSSAFLYVSTRFQKQPRVISAQREAALMIGGGAVMGAIEAYAFGVVDSDHIHEKIRQEYAAMLDRYEKENIPMPVGQVSTAQQAISFQDKVRERQIIAAQSSATPPL